MRLKEDRFVFTEHSLKRGLERIVGQLGEYTQTDYDKIKKLILLNMNWNTFSCNWELRDWDLVFIIKNDRVVTIAPMEDKNKDVTKIRRITQHHKDNVKRYMRLGRTQNSYSKN